MTESAIVVLVLPRGQARVATTTDLDSALRQWRRRYGVFLPIAAFECNPVAFCDAAGLNKLPASVSLDWVAEHLRNAPVSQNLQPAVFRHIRRLGDNSGPLFLEWAGAVLSRSGDAG